MPICQIILSLSNVSSKKGFIKNWRLFCFWLILVFFLLSYSRCLFSTYSHMNQWLMEPTTFIQNGPSIWDCVWALLQWFGSHCMLFITFWLNLAHLKRYDFCSKFRLSSYLCTASVCDRSFHELMTYNNQSWIHEVWFFSHKICCLFSYVSNGFLFKIKKEMMK